MFCPRNVSSPDVFMGKLEELTSYLGLYTFLERFRDNLQPDALTAKDRCRAPTFFTRLPVFVHVRFQPVSVSGAVVKYSRVGNGGCRRQRSSRMGSG